MQDRYWRAMMTSMGCDPALVEQPGVSVVPDPNRAENHSSAGYMLGEHLVIWCDPEAESMLAEATAVLEPTLESWIAYATEASEHTFGIGRNQLLVRDLGRPVLPDGFAFRSLDRDDADDVALISRFIDANSEDDLDEAEIGLDELDETIEVVVTVEGEIATFSSARPLEEALEFGDIGIATTPAFRGKGLGRAAVTTLCPRLRAVGLEPLYRCDETNTGSVALSQSMGFEPAIRLAVYRFTT